MRGWEDPYLKIGEANVRNTKADSDYVWALKDINLEVMPGEVLGIIGKNGAGKSTLLKILSKVTGPTTGTIDYNGRIGALLEVGTGFHPELTGRENIFLNGAILGMTKAEIKGKLDEIIDFSGVERYIDTPVKRYSSGMMVRLGFAVAAHLEPEILIVDEVLAVGDAEFQKKAIGKMQDISKNDGRTVLFVSHNMLAIENLCDRCVLMENGNLAGDGRSFNIISKYLDNRLSEQRQLISDRTDRSGTGRYRIRDLEINNENGDKIIRSFDRLSIKVKLDGKLEDKLNLRIIIGAYELTGNALFRIDSGEVCIRENQGYDTIFLSTSEINLVATVCYLNIALYIDGTMADYLINVKQFEIIEKQVDNIQLFRRDLATILLESSINLG